MQEPTLVDDQLVLCVEGANGPAALAFNPRTVMRLATTGPRRAVPLGRYSEVLERGRAVDILGQQSSGAFEPVAFWCSARYAGQRKSGSRKPDSEFVMILASAAKDERIAARHLAALGHRVEGHATTELRPYVVTLSASLGGRSSRTDLRCLRCAKQFEVKGRPNDDLVRFSHSPIRPFTSENAPDDLQILVFRHREVRAFSNRDVADALAAESGARDHVDSWVELTLEWANAYEVSSADLRCRG